MAKAKAVNPLLPKIKLECCTGDYSLCYTYRALKTAEKMLRAAGYTKQESNLLASLSLQGIDATQLSILVFAGLITHHPTITLDEVDEQVITFENMFQFPDYINAAYILAMPSLAKPEDAKPDPTQPE
ncbi:hypothetical protein [Tunturiibacter gelidiferens]|uniref:hypothetical protein n=1 Tax=Tunturiibacter gelidiferens TaxID=3069689 RepID=UPI003D9B9537